VNQECDECEYGWKKPKPVGEKNFYQYAPDPSAPTSVSVSGRYACRWKPPVALRLARFPPKSFGMAGRVDPADSLNQRRPDF
jgi:hypothetical protein